MATTIYSGITTASLHPLLVAPALFPLVPSSPVHQEAATYESIRRHSLLSIRGGGSDADDMVEEALDLARTTIRLDSINTYSIVSALVLEAAFKLYSDTDKDFTDDADGGDDCTKCAPWKQATRFVFIVSAMISIICGTYTTVVFSLLGLYSKSALGMGQDASFLEFYSITAKVRKRAFDAFLVTLVSFELCFTTSLLLNYNGRIRVWSVLIALVAARVSWVHWQYIVKMAGVLLYGK